MPENKTDCLKNNVAAQILNNNCNYKVMKIKRNYKKTIKFNNLHLLNNDLTMTEIYLNFNVW